jgi:hypothetical protein
MSIILPAAPASAANLDGTCDSGEYGMYDVVFWEPGIHDRSDAQVADFSGLSWFGVGGFMNNDTSSLWNRTGSTKCLYQFASFGQPSYCLGMNTSAGTLGAMDQNGSSYK